MGIGIKLITSYHWVGEIRVYPYKILRWYGYRFIVKIVKVPTTYSQIRKVRRGRNGTMSLNRNK